VDAVPRELHFVAHLCDRWTSDCARRENRAFGGSCRSLRRERPRAQAGFCASAPAVPQVSTHKPKSGNLSHDPWGCLSDPEPRGSRLLGLSAAYPSPVFAETRRLPSRSLSGFLTLLGSSRSPPTSRVPSTRRSR
jgi:hypothetical protein